MLFPFSLWVYLLPGVILNKFTFYCRHMTILTCFFILCRAYFLPCPKCAYMTFPTHLTCSEELVLLSNGMRSARCCGATQFTIVQVTTIAIYTFCQIHTAWFYSFICENSLRGVASQAKCKLISISFFLKRSIGKTMGMGRILPFIINISMAISAPFRFGSLHSFFSEFRINNTTG